jgi:hypothetical protein
MVQKPVLLIYKNKKKGIKNMDHLIEPKGLVFELIPSMNPDLSSVDDVIKEILRKH